MKYYFVAIFFLVLNEAESNDGWVEPHAWGREEAKQPNEPSSGFSSDNLNTCSDLDERVSFIYYKKLISIIFDQNKFIYDKDTGTLTRAIEISLTKNEFDSLVTSLDPKQLDAVLSDVLHNMRKPLQSRCNNYSLGIFEEMRLFWMNISLSAEMNFILMATTFILLSFYIHKKYSHGLLATFICGFFIIGFVHSYLDCNRKLQIEQLAEALEPKKNPCEEIEPKGLWKYVSFFWKNSKKSECVEHMKNTHKIQLNYCRPDEVFMSYLNELILNQFMLMIQRITEILKSCIEKISFPYNIVAVVVIGITFSSYMTNIFQYIISPKNWKSYWGSKRKRSSSETEADHERKDCVSGENLKALLNMFQHNMVKPKENGNQIKAPENSCVEEIEAISHNEKNVDLQKEPLLENKVEKSKELIKCEDLGADC